MIFFKKTSLRQGRSKHRSRKLFREGGVVAGTPGKRVLVEATSWCGCQSWPALSKLSQALLVFPVPSQHRHLFLRALSRFIWLSCRLFLDILYISEGSSARCLPDLLCSQIHSPLRVSVTCSTSQLFRHKTNTFWHLPWKTGHPVCALLPPVSLSLSLVMPVFRALIFKRLWSPGIDQRMNSASLCSLTSGGPVR